MAANKGPVKVACITGGASGLGLEVATRLAQQGGWKVFLLDINSSAGQSAQESIGPSAEFIQCDVSSYRNLADAFDKMFVGQKRLDFVFANAGVIEKVDFYERHPAGSPPPELDQFVIGVNLQSVINTAYLALHYFRQCKDVSNRSIILTGSVGSLYPTFSIPMYAAAKHGILGFLRSVDRYYHNEGIRVNAILPGVVATGLLTQEELDTYPKDSFTPIESVVSTVLQIIQGDSMTDSKSRSVAGKDMHGQAVEINIKNIYFRYQPEWCDEKMQGVMEATDR